MMRANAAQRVALAVEHASVAHPELATMAVSPHTIRHTTAMHLLQSGVVLSVIALWLGHASPTTTHGYAEADMAMKEQAVACAQTPGTKAGRYRPPDALAAFLRAL